MAGALAGSVLRRLRVVELAGLAPAPFAGMILSDFGADVVRVDKPVAFTVDTLSRGKRSIAVNLKDPRGVEVVKNLCKEADVLIEPFRPGTMEKIGLGPDELCAANPRLIYARLTGFGQHGPYAAKAGHDINYLSVAGVLAALGTPGAPPRPPINLLADFAGGGFLCAFGILAAVIERFSSGKGQVIDSAMVDGCTYLSSFLHTSKRVGLWTGPPGTNLLDGAAPFYRAFETKDKQYMAVGAIEPQFYSALIAGLGLDDDALPNQNDTEAWPEMHRRFEAAFRSKTRAEWEAVFAELDACVTPVVGMDEVAGDAHATARAQFATAPDGISEPTPAPRLSRTPAELRTLEPIAVGQHTLAVLQELGLSREQMAALEADGVIMTGKPPAASL